MDGPVQVLEARRFVRGLGDAVDGVLEELGLLPLGDVLHHADHPPGPPVLVDEEEAAVVDPAISAESVPEAVIDVERLAGLLRFLEEADGFGAVLGVDPLGPLDDAAHVLEAVAEDLFEAAAPVDQARGRVIIVDDLSRGLDDELEPLLPGRGRFLALLAPGDVVGDAHDDGLAPDAEGEGPDLDRDLAPVLAGEDELVRTRGPAQDVLGQEAGRPDQLAFREEMGLEEVLADELRAAEPEHPLGFDVPVDETALEVHEVERVRGVVEQELQPVEGELPSDADPVRGRQAVPRRLRPGGAAAGEVRLGPQSQRTDGQSGERSQNVGFALGGLRQGEGRTAEDPHDDLGDIVGPRGGSGHPLQEWKEG